MRRIIFFLLSSFLLFTLFTKSAWAASTYYVSTTGSDTNPGTLALPWKTIQKAVNSVNAGDTINIMGGTYNESIQIQKTGTSSNPIKLTNYNGQTVTINGGTSYALGPGSQLPQYWIVDGLRLYSTGNLTIQYNTWTSSGICQGADHWTFRNNYISGSVEICGADTLFEGNEVDGSNSNGNGGNGVQDLQETSHNNIFRNNTVHNFSTRGIWSEIRTHDDLFEGNIVHDISSSESYCINTDGFGTVEWRQTIRNNQLYKCGTGVMMENTFASTVENNVIHDTNIRGIWVFSYGPHYTQEGTMRCQVGGENNQYGDTNGDNNCEGDLTNDILRQNLIYNHGDVGIMVYYAGGVEISGNTIAGNSSSQWGIAINPNAAVTPQTKMQSNISSGHSDAEVFVGDYISLTVDNNNLFNNSNLTHAYKTQSGKTYWYYLSLPQYQTASGKGQNSIFADPQFVNLVNGDFHLKSISPAIDKGVDIGLTSDITNISRPQGIGYDIGSYEFVSGVVPTPTATPVFLIGDINKDGTVNIQDFTLLSNAFDTVNSAADLNSDAIVNIQDYILLSNNFGKNG
jgi:hypothetical protein